MSCTSKAHDHGRMPLLRIVLSSEKLAGRGDDPGVEDRSATYDALMAVKSSARRSYRSFRGGLSESDVRTMVGGKSRLEARREIVASIGAAVDTLRLRFLVSTMVTSTLKFDRSRVERK